MYWIVVVRTNPQPTPFACSCWQWGRPALENQMPARWACCSSSSLACSAAAFSRDYSLVKKIVQATRQTIQFLQYLSYESSIFISSHLLQYLTTYESSNIPSLLLHPHCKHYLCLAGSWLQAILAAELSCAFRLFVEVSVPAIPFLIEFGAVHDLFCSFDASIHFKLLSTLTIVHGFLQES